MNQQWNTSLEMYMRFQVMKMMEYKQKFKDTWLNPKRENPLGWWRANAHCFPHMQRQAKRFLCRSTTSLPSERLFSAAGHTVTNGRARLDSDTVDEFLFLHSYYKEKGSAYKQEVMQTEERDCFRGCNSTFANSDIWKITLRELCTVIHIHFKG